MRRPRGHVPAALLVAVLGLAGCGGGSHESPNSSAVRVGKVPGTGLTRLVLSPEAATRLGVQTARVRSVPRLLGRPLIAIPYAAVIYDPNGAASTYTSPLPRVFVRTPIVVDHLSGNQAYLRRGPRPGARVVAVGGAELLGAETGVEDQ